MTHQHDAHQVRAKWVQIRGAAYRQTCAGVYYPAGGDDRLMHNVTNGVDGMSYLCFQEAKKRSC